MGIKFRCPNGHKLNVKSFLAGKRGICPHCGAKVQIPDEAEREHAAEIAAQRGGVAVAVGAASVADTVTLPTTTTHPTVAPATSAAVVATPSLPMTAPAVSAAPIATAAMPAPATPAAPVNTGPIVPVGSAAPIAAPLVPAQPVVATPLAPSPYAVMPAAPVDPIAEAPNAVWYVRPPSGGQFGPARGDVMRKWLGEGRVSADSLVWRDGWVDWKSAAAVFPQLAPASSPAAIATDDPVAMGPKSSTNTAARTLRAKKRSNTFAIGMVVTLGLLAVVLLVVFIFVLSGLNQA